jgi:hypothetical protein
MAMKFYRYELVQYAAKDLDGEYINSTFPNPTLTLCEYDLISETPKGYWIGFSGGMKLKYKWVSKTAKKRFAYPSKKDAMTNFIRRTEKRIKILNYQLTSCIIGLSLADSKKI